MLSGRRLDLLDPSPLDIEIEDIAHGLSRLARWNGQTLGANAFSVAQHCLVVETIAARMAPGIGRKTRLLALLHDAAEYVIGDLISPFKAAVGLDYKSFERQLQGAIHMRFGMPLVPDASQARLIKNADRASAFVESHQLAGFALKDAMKFFGRPDGIADLVLVPLPPDEAKALYLARFETLIEGRDA